MEEAHGCRTIGEEVDAKLLSDPRNGHRFESSKRTFYTPREWTRIYQ